MSIVRRLNFARVSGALLRSVAIASLVVLAVGAGYVRPAAARTNGAYLMDADSGQVLLAKNADVPNHPASLTKMMTLYLLFDALEKGKVHLGDGMKVSMHAARQSASKLGLEPGESIKVEDAILALVTKSANDAAVVIAEYLGGSEPAFATQMTKKARELGMQRTVFRNASGLPIAGQWSTPHDMALLARALIRNHAREYHYFATKQFEYDGQVIATHNHLLNYYPGADGIKTGYIASSGFNLVASAKRNGHRLIGVVFGGNTVHARDREMVSLLDAGFAREPGTTQIEIAKATPPKDDADTAATPDNEADAEDPQVSAVMQSMADGHPAAPAAEAPQAAAQDTTQEASAGDAEDPPWGIQLGSFAQRAKAQKVAEAAAMRLGDLVSDGHTEVAATTRNKAVLYRALLIGLAESDAQRACKTLRHHRTPCRVINTDRDMAAR